MELSPQQQSVLDWVDNGTGNAILIAVAGSGKTTTLLEVLARTQDSRTALCAYNKKIADEISAKLSDRGLKGNAATFHSFGFSAWRKTNRNVRVDGKKTYNLIDQTADIHKLYHTFIAQAVSLAKQAGIGIWCPIDDPDEWDELVAHFGLDELLYSDAGNGDPITGVNYAIRILEKSNAVGGETIDFDDMIYLPLLYRSRFDQYDWVLVDEAQDSNWTRRELAARILAPNGRLIAVGDPHQAIYGFCHPPETLVKVPDGYRPIDQLSVGDPVIIGSADSNAAGFDGSKTISAIHVYEHSGMLVTLNVAGRSVTMTPHHRVPLRNNPSAEYFTYLMRRRGVYRVGRCKAKTTNGTMFAQRCHMEGADAGWLLAAHSTKAEADSSEAILLERVKGDTFSKMTDDEVFALPSDEEQALAILSEHGRMVDFPFWTPESNHSGYSFVTEVCNALPGMLATFYGDPEGGKRGRGRHNGTWEPIDLSYHHYSGKVYGITVPSLTTREGYKSRHLYFAGDEGGDGLDVLVHNTGADSDSLDIIRRNFEAVDLPLTVSFRCPKEVVAVAQEYVQHIQAAESAEDGIYRVINEREFKGYGAAELDSESAVLCRNTAPLVELAYDLIGRGIPCHVEGRDIGAGLKKLLGRWTRIRDLREWLAKLDEWSAVEIAALNKKRRETQAQSVEDKVETIHVLADGCETKDDLYRKIDTLFADVEPGQPAPNLTLSTIHKSKGREWNRVYWLGANRYQPSPYAKQLWQIQQEVNLQYVAATRAKHELVSVTVENLGNKR